MTTRGCTDGRAFLCGRSEVAEAEHSGDKGEECADSQPCGDDPVDLPQGQGAADEQAAEADQQHPYDRCAHSVPLVDGTPVTRGSRSQADRSARATALNWHSTMWWGMRP